MARVAPVVASVAAFLLRLHERELGIHLADLSDCALPRPLEARALNVPAAVGVVEDGARHFERRTLHRAEVELRAASLERRTEVLPDERRKRLRLPRAAREHLVAVELVLRHHHPNRDSLCAVCVDVLPEVLRIRREMRIVAEKAVFALAHALLRRAVVLRPCGVCLRLRCVCAGLLHPERRTPRRGPHLERSVVSRKNFLQERQQRLAVALYGKLLHREVAGRLGVGIEVRREVARTDWRADNRKRAPVLREHLVENRLPIRLAQRGEGIPAELARAHAEPEHRLVRRRNVEAQVSARGLRRLHGRRRVVPAFGECRRPEFNALRRNGADGQKETSCNLDFLHDHYLFKVKQHRCHLIIRIRPLPSESEPLPVTNGHVSADTLPLIFCPL